MKQICQLNDLRQKSNEKSAEENPEKLTELTKDRSISFTPAEYFKKLQSAILHAPEHILITVTHDPVNTTFIEDALGRYTRIPRGLAAGPL